MNHFLFQSSNVEYNQYALPHKALVHLNRYSKYNDTHLIPMSSKAKVFIAGILLALLLLFYGINGLFIADAEAGIKERGDRLYTSISIQRGDNLWNIAKEYLKTDDVTEIKKYVTEIKSINHIDRDILYSGQNLIVYYYNELIE